MPTQLQPPRGTHDLIGEDQRRHTRVVDTARRIAATYGFDEWTTPIFEDTRVFSRTLGETSDVVTKEMYSFTDRGGDPITLRPEATAGICRALVSNGLTQSLPQKVFVAGPMFRYERPQKGRYRQFHQIDIEAIGPAEPLADAEVIACGWAILQALGVAGETILEINTLGDKESRAAYREALVGYFTQHKDALSPDSRDRLERNPLRILDSKDEGDRRIVANAPVIAGHLTEPAAAFYASVRTWLDRFGVPYRENPRIVRGLDYYGHTAFEFVTSKLGAQGTVMGGGRYDGLVEEMGGPPTPAVGLAAGVERLAMLLEQPPVPPATIAVVPVGEAAEAAALDLLQALRGAGMRAEMAYRGNLRRRMERANRTGARAAVIVGDNDLAQGVAQVKNLATGEQEAVPLADVVGRLG
ncbi:MAG TPA: histidine--tRNA ligase [Acetobacteraceae bacterium]|nr:histidine--tRNA ligase [Acetobacteraceae bacterium]